MYERERRKYSNKGSVNFKSVTLKGKNLTTNPVRSSGWAMSEGQRSEGVY